IFSSARGASLPSLSRSPFVKGLGGGCPAGAGATAGAAAGAAAGAVGEGGGRSLRHCAPLLGGTPSALGAPDGNLGGGPVSPFPRRRRVSPRPSMSAAVRGSTG